MTKGRVVLVGGVVAWACAMGAVSATAAELSAEQILEKNAAARGGADAWQKVHSVVWVGHIETAGARGGNMPFVLEMEHPNKTHFEIKARDQTSLRVYDGAHGWKLRPVQNGVPDLQPYSQQELDSARDEEGLGRPLLASGLTAADVALEGVDEVEGRKAYRLGLKLPSGGSRHVWIDATSFLDVKYDREAKTAFGQKGIVSVFYRDYRTNSGLKIPFLIETGAGAGQATDKMVIDTVVLNPALDERTFGKPVVPLRRKMASVQAEAPPGVGDRLQPAQSFVRRPVAPLSLAPAGVAGTR